MAGNIIVSTTVNKVTWDVDRTSYGRAMKAVKSLKTEWEKAGKAFATNKADPAAALKRSALQARLVNKRLQQTERAEQAKTTAHAIAMAKKEARAREAIDKIQRARRKQAVSQLTARRSPESQADYNGLKARLRQMEKTGGGYGTNPSISAARQQALREELARRAAASNSSGMVGNARPMDQSVIDRQNRAMAQSVQREQAKVSKEQARAREQQRKKDAAEDLRYSRYLAGKESTVANASTRLRSKYGDNYASKLKGFDSLKERFLDSNTMRSSNFRAELAAMEAGLKRAKASTLSFNDGMRNLRSTLISVTAAYGAFNAAASVVRTGQFFQGMNATMLMVSDDSVEAGKRLKFVRDQSYRLGLDLKVAAQGYTQMSIAANGVLTKNQNDDLFRSFSEYATALQVDPVKYQRGITAIQQMMGKGQIMAEELKQQLAEGIPGSLQVFVKATQEAFGDSTIGVEKLMDMMKNGDLKAAKILPYVAKYYSEAANKGGALETALKGNRVAMQRLTLTWMDFQNKVFESGFGEELTSVFNELSQILDGNSPLAQNLGQFFAGFTEGFMDMVYTVYNTFILIQGIMEHFIPVLRKNGEEISSGWKWSGWALGAIFFAGALYRVFRILSKIAGLSGALGFLGKIFKNPGVVAAAGGAGAGAAATGTTGTPFSNVAGRVGAFLQKFPILGKIGKAFSPISAANNLGHSVYDQFIRSEDTKFSREGLTPDMQKQIQDKYGFSIHRPGLLDVFSEISGWWSGLGNNNNLGYLNGGPSLPPGVAQSIPPFAMGPQQVEGTINIDIKTDGLKDLIDARIDAQAMNNINLILGVPD